MRTLPSSFVLRCARGVSLIGANLSEGHRKKGGEKAGGRAFHGTVKKICKVRTRRSDMPHRTHDTTTSELVQAAPCAADDWTREVVTRLPATVQHQARKLKAFERSRQ